MAATKKTKPRRKSKSTSLRQKKVAVGAAQSRQRTGPGGALGLRDRLQAGRAASRMATLQGQYDFVLLAVVAVLVGLGLVMIFSASYAHANQYYDQSTYFFLRQLRWLVLGAAVMAIAAFVDYRKWLPLSVLAMAGTVALLVAVLIFGDRNLGARRHLFGGSIQPSEFAKLTITFYVAYWLTTKGNRLREVSYGLVPFAVLMGLVAGLLLLEPDIGTTVLLVLTAFAMFFIAGADTKQLLLSLVLSAATLVLTITQIDYASKRVQEFLIAIKDPLEASYHIQQGAVAMASGGLIGLGLGDGASKLPGGLPLPWSDSIFAVVGEELGLIGTMAVVGLFLFLGYRGLRIALRTRDRFGMVLACGITAWLMLQAFINMAVNTATLPFSGMPLPFISYGGSSLLICLAGIGVLLSISRYGNEETEGNAGTVRRDGANTAIRRRHWWPRIPNLGGARRPAKATAKRAAATQEYRQRSRSGYSLKSASFGRPKGLQRQFARTRRAVARRNFNRSGGRAGTARTGARRVPRRR